MSSIMVIRRYRCRPATIDGKKPAFHEDGFLQICGAVTEAEMHLICDSLSPLRKSPYKLCCNCQHCISYSYEDVAQKILAEPFMRAVNIVFNILCKCNYILQSTSSVQNYDGSNTITWVWIKQLI